MVDLPGGTSRRLDTPESVGRAAIKWFEAGPEGRTLFLIGQPGVGSRENEILAFDVATGSHRVLGTARAIPNSLAVAPDGSAVAFIARVERGEVELRIMPVSGTDSVRTVYRAAAGRMSAPVAWMPDGTRLAFELWEGDGTAGLWSVDRRGGDAVPLLRGCCRENDVRFDRTGRLAAFAAGIQVGEIWILRF